MGRGGWERARVTSVFFQERSFLVLPGSEPLIYSGERARTSPRHPPCDSTRKRCPRASRTFPHRPGHSDDRKVVWNCIECTHISNPEAKATPQQVRAEVWMSLVRGSRGLIY